eukprot:3415511-Prorocentrum_lima.AAC.1
MLGQRGAGWAGCSGVGEPRCGAVGLFSRWFVMLVWKVVYVIRKGGSQIGWFGGTQGGWSGGSSDGLGEEGGVTVLWGTSAWGRE